MSDPTTKMPWEGRPAQRAAYWWQSLAQTLSDGRTPCVHQQAFADRAAAMEDKPLPWEGRTSERYWWHEIAVTLLGGKPMCDHQSVWLDAHGDDVDNDEPMPTKGGVQGEMWWWRDIVSSLTSGQALCRHQTAWLKTQDEVTVESAEIATQANS